MARGSKCVEVFTNNSCGPGTQDLSSLMKPPAERFSRRFPRDFIRQESTPSVKLSDGPVEESEIGAARRIPQ